MKEKIDGFQGYSSALSILQTPPNVIRYLNNAYVKNGAVRKRKAFKTISSPNESIVSGAIEFLFGAGPRGVLFKQQGSPYKWFTVTDSSLSTKVDRGANYGSPIYPPQFAEYNNCIYAFDGTTRPMKLCTVGGTLTWTRQGMTIDTVQLGGAWNNTLFNLTGPNLATASWTTGVYYYALTLVITTDQGTIETNADVGILGTGTGLTVTVGVTNTPKMTMAAMVSAPPGLVAVRLYRMSTAIGQTNYYFIKEVATTDGSFTFSDDTGAGNPNSQDLTRPIPTRNTQLTAAVNAACFHKNRIYGGYDNQLLFTEVGYPEYWPATNVIVVGNPTDKITALHSTPIGVIIQKQQSVWMLQGTSFADFELRQIHFGQGNISYKSGVMCRNAFYSVNTGGLWKWPLDSNEPIRISDLIFEDFVAIDPIVLDRTAMLFDPVNNWLWIMPVDGNLYIYDIIIDRFVGKFAVSGTVPSCLFLVNRFTNNQRVGAFFENGILSSYNELSATSGSFEGSLDVEIRAGMMWGKTDLEKVFKTFTLWDRLALNYSASSTENISVFLNDAKQSSAKSIGTITLNDKAVNTIGLNQHAAKLAGLIVSGTGLNFSKEWAITGYQFEYDDTGHIR